MKNIIKRCSPEVPMFFLGFTIILVLLWLFKFKYSQDILEIIVSTSYLSGAIIAWLKYYRQLMRAEDNEE